MKAKPALCRMLFIILFLPGAAKNEPRPDRPFWLSSIMEGESVLFIQSDQGLPKASLWFRPSRILKITSSSGEVTYSEGQDYTWKPGSREISLTTHSRIVFKTPQDLRRPAKSQRYVLSHRDGRGEIYFGGGHEYHDIQTVVTYEHESDRWAGPATSFAGEQLPRTIRKLSQDKALVVALLGDSISTGCNASGWAQTAPFQPPYQDLLTRNLEAAYGAKVTLKNLSVGGTDTVWGIKNIGKVNEAAPDLVLVAFGMNDSHRRPAPEYQANIRAMVDAVRAVHRDCEFILIAPMLGNPDWTALHQEWFPEYRDALKQLTQTGITVADLTSVWIEMLKHKPYWDLTGNGVNHPNDFGHRIYAQVLTSLLVQ
jgi:lysophospholipase L1-like esterase